MRPDLGQWAEKAEGAATVASPILDAPDPGQAREPQPACRLNT